MAIDVDGERLTRELGELAGFTGVEPSAEGTAVTRVVFTADDLRARGWLKGLAEAEGFGVREDAVGNTFIRWEGTEPGLAAVATGSHIDAIPHAGMYDGTVGVVGGLEAMRALKRSGVRLRRSVELVLLTSEEPTRFGIGCLGSRLMAGTISGVAADGLRDKDGATLAEVRTAAGFAGSLDSVRMSPGHYSAWVELHIEQGPLLEREAIALNLAAGTLLGLVTSIAAPAGYRFTIEGLGGHAGALLMPDRRDALCAAAELVLGVERCALATGAIDTVATVGTCGVYPGAVNSVPSRVTLELDIRDTDPERREGVMRALRVEIAGISERRGVKITEEMVNADMPAASSERIVGVVEEVCGELGIATRRMVSRAYHDSLFLAQVASIAMIFIPCRGGVSHRPDEFAKPEDIAAGVRVLTGALAKLGSD
jgi:ureidoglycolate amidohydrolase